MLYLEIHWLVSRNKIPPNERGDKGWLSILILAFFSFAFYFLSFLLCVGSIHHDRINKWCSLNDVFQLWLLSSHPKNLAMSGSESDFYVVESKSKFFSLLNSKSQRALHRMWVTVYFRNLRIQSGLKKCRRMNRWKDRKPNHITGRMFVIN